MESQIPSPVVLPVRGKHPQFGSRNWLAPNCTVVGDVLTGDDCSIWFGAIVRGDVCAIRLGTRVNIQDGAVLHGTWEKTDLTIGDEASIGHNAIVHGCTVEDRALIGMGAEPQSPRLRQCVREPGLVGAPCAELQLRCHLLRG